GVSAGGPREVGGGGNEEPVGALAGEHFARALESSIASWGVHARTLARPLLGVKAATRLRPPMSARALVRRCASPIAALAIVLAGGLIAGCGPAAAPRVTFVWAVGQGEPRFDPGGPPDPVRWAVERLLDRGLVVED